MAGLFQRLLVALCFGDMVAICDSRYQIAQIKTSARYRFCQMVALIPASRSAENQVGYVIGKFNASTPPRRFNAQLGQPMNIGLLLGNRQRRHVLGDWIRVGLGMLDAKKFRPPWPIQNNIARPFHFFR